MTRDSAVAAARHLDFASYGPPSAESVAAAQRALSAAAEGRDARSWHAATDDAAAAAARLLAVPADAVALFPSTSHALFSVAFGLAGGRMLVSPGESPANPDPWWRAQEAGILQVASLPTDGRGLLTPVIPQRVADALQPATTAVSVSAVDFRTGRRTDLAGIRAVIGDRLLIVDAIQAFGVVEADWSAADVVIAGGQKWLRAGWGVALAAYSPRALERIAPRLGGWAGVVDPSVYDGRPHPPAAGARRFAATMDSPVAAASLAASLVAVEAQGIDRIEQDVADRTDLLSALLRDGGAELVSPVASADRAGIVVARWTDAADRHDRLTRAGIATTLHEPDRIRFSVHAHTPEELLVEAAELAGENPCPSPGTPRPTVGNPPTRT
jgi:selenocysteine lyase/cysteine desulfurase